MTTDLEKLIALQTEDGEATRRKAKLNALPGTLARIDAQLAAARQRVEDARAAIKAGETAKRQLEREIESLNEKILKFRGQSSSVKTNEQYKALLSEIAHFEGEISANEEKILEILMRADELAGQLAAAEAALKDESVAIEREKQEAERHGDEDRAALAASDQRRTALRAAIDDSILATYDRIARTRGTALAEVVDHRCIACQVMLRPQVLSNVKAAQEVIQCDSCGRMLYYLPEHNIAKVAARESGITNQAEREWMFIPSLGTHGAFAIFQNHKGTASMKAYDAVSGEAIAKRVEKNSLYQAIFAEELKEARNLFVDEANLEDKYKEQLPAEVVQELRHQLPK